MSQYFAFLRAINVGGRNVTMQSLRKHFEALGFDKVETFIASGNVIFHSPTEDAGTLEQTIESHLHKSLGYEVKTFVRTGPELAAIGRYEPFERLAIQSAGALVVGFLADRMVPEAEAALMALKTDVDDFHVQGREIYWFCKVRQSESKVSNALFEKRVKVRSTFRNVNTVARLVAKYKLST